MKKLVFLLMTVVLSGTIHAQICQVTITHVITGNQVQYFGTSPDSPATWSWFFNGGTPMTSTQQNPVVTYAAPGTYVGAVSVTGGPNNCSAALSTDRDTVIIATTGFAENTITPAFRIRQDASGSELIIETERPRYITARLYEISGRCTGIIFEGEVHQGINHLRMDAQTLNKSIYLIEAESDGERTVCRFIARQN